MNEELRARAIEAAAKVYGLPPDPSTWDLLDDETKESSRNLSTVFVDAVLAVVADWCDEQDALTMDEHGNFFGTFGWDHSSNEGASHAFDHVAGACRPVGEET